MGTGVSRGVAVRQRREAGMLVVQPQQDRRFARHRFPPKAALFVDCRSAILPNQLTRLSMALQRGETVQLRPRGNSMAGKVESGQLCTVEPIRDSELRVGDIVLCKVNGQQYLHLIKAIQGKRFQIGNNRGRINGWITAGAIFGRCIRVE